MEDMEDKVQGTRVENPVGEGTAPRKKVLLSFVGRNDPYGQKKRSQNIVPDNDELRPQDKWGSILTICEHIQPDIVYLFPSCKEKNPEKNTEGNAEKVKAILLEKQGDQPSLLCNIWPMDVQDATDFEEISVEMEKKIDGVLRELGEPARYEFHWNCSSGTPQMKAVGYVFFNSGKIPGIKRWQCKDPQDLQPGEERLREINTAFLDESVYKKRIEAGIKRLAFLSVKENSDGLSKKAGSEKLCRIGTLLSQIFDAYTFMDVLRYQDAYDKLRDVEQNPTFDGLLNDELKKILKDQVKALEVLKPQGNSIEDNIKETPQNLVDLYFNMQRCFEQGNYADVLARFWRMGEGSLYYRLESEWGINPRDLNNSSNKNSLAILRQESRYQPTRHRKEFIGFEGGRKALLEVFKDKAYIEMWKSYTKEQYYPSKKVWDENRIISLINKRNDSIVAHGMRPVLKENAEDCLPIAEAMLLALVPDAEQRIREYPFKKELIARWMMLF